MPELALSRSQSILGRLIQPHREGVGISAEELVTFVSRCGEFNAPCGGLASELEGQVSEPGDPTVPLSLDVVRARIFYLACDVEAASPPAAMLLRAVADAISENDMVVEGLNALASLNGASVHALPQGSVIRPLVSRVRDEAPIAEQLLGAVSSQSGYKR